MMQASKISNVIYDVKKLKKDGSIPSVCVENIIRSLKAGEIFVMPIDSVYGIVGIKRDDVIKEIMSISGEYADNIEIIISNFKMLEEMAVIDKFSYNFLKRVWPGEVTVQLKNKSGCPEQNLFVRMPRHKYILDIVNGVGMPIVYISAKTNIRKAIYTDRDILKRFKDICSMLIVSEFNKSHSMPTLIDVSSDRLNIINEGRVSAEEIKSLYFLGDL